MQAFDEGRGKEGKRVDVRDSVAWERKPFQNLS